MRVMHVEPKGRKPSAEGYPPVRGSGPASTSLFVGEVETQGVIGDDLGRELRLIEVVGGLVGKGSSGDPALPVRAK